MDHFARLRRSSFTPAFIQSNEPLIVVEESEFGEREETLDESVQTTPKYSLDIDSPCNPYLLSPWRDPRETRKHSLPTPPCTSGITASQVRRLSEQGGEQITPREQEFLATLSQAPQPQPGGRRHSVVTISKVPTTVFGRSRRESIAVCAPGTRGSSRRESVGPPSTDPRGSVHNIQLDLMDDILQTKKARMKLWNTSSEKVCEIQPLNEASTSSPLRYTNRRYSDFVATAPLAPIQSFRRASENPNMISPSIREHPIISETPRKKAGIICSNTDLMSLLTSLASSATEINRIGETSPNRSRTAATTPSTLAPPIDTSRKNRSNSFDVSILHSIKQMATGTEEKAAATPEPASGSAANWFAKRHQTMEKKSAKPAHPTVTFAKEALDRFREKENEPKKPASKRRSPLNRLKWDGKSAMVDARMIGSAIEGFLRRDNTSSSTSATSSKGATKKTTDRKASTSKASSSGKATSWFGGRTEDDSNETCESSLCSTLKDLFVK